MAKAFKKALNAYLFNVEYGYAPPKKKGCKWQALSSDPYWTKKEREIRNEDNLVKMEKLIKNYDKDSLKMNLKKKIETWGKWLSEYFPKLTTQNIIEYVANQIDEFEKKSVDIPYYCTNGNTYSKIGTYEASRYNGKSIPELLYVTKFEQKLYDLEWMLREKLGFSKETDYYYTTTLFFTYTSWNYGKEKRWFSKTNLMTESLYQLIIF